MKNVITPSANVDHSTSIRNDNHVAFINEFARKLKITNPEHWYHISHRNLIQNGASELLATYNDSLPQLLKAVYPQYLIFLNFTHFFRHQWDASKFTQLDKYWEEDKLDYTHHQKSFLNEIGQKLNITNQSDWYSITSEAFRKVGGTPLLNKYNGSLSKLLVTVYPEYQQINEELASHICVKPIATVISYRKRVVLSWISLFVNMIDMRGIGIDRDTEDVDTGHPYKHNENLWTLLPKSLVSSTTMK